MLAPPQGFQDVDGASPTIGFPVVGGTANAVLYVDSSGNLGNEAAFAYDASGNRLSVDKVYLADGATGATNLALSFASDTDLGWFRQGSNLVQLVGSHHISLGEFIGANSGVISLNYYNSHIKMAAAHTLDWSATAGDASAATDVALQRDAAGVLAQAVIGTAQEHRIYGRYVSATNRNYLTIKHSIATVTASAGATVVATNVIPAKVIIIGVGTTVTTALGTGSGTTGYNVGDGSDADRWGAIVGTAIGTDSDYSDYTAAPIPAWNAAAQSITLTATGGNFDGTGVISVDVAYIVVESD